MSSQPVDDMSPAQMLALMPQPGEEITILHHAVMYRMIRNMVDGLVTERADTAQQATREMVDFVFNVFLGKVVAEGGTTILKEGHVPLPKNAEEAEAMVKLGLMWLEQNQSIDIAKKTAVSGLMRRAAVFRHADSKDYDRAYKDLQDALYKVIKTPT